jgi:hypothetical protein
VREQRLLPRLLLLDDVGKLLQLQLLVGALGQLHAAHHALRCCGGVGCQRAQADEQLLRQLWRLLLPVEAPGPRLQAGDERQHGGPRCRLQRGAAPRLQLRQPRQQALQPRVAACERQPLQGAGQPRQRQPHLWLQLLRGHVLRDALHQLLLLGAVGPQAAQLGEARERLPQLLRVQAGQQRLVVLREPAVVVRVRARVCVCVVRACRGSKTPVSHARTHPACISQQPRSNKHHSCPPTNACAPRQQLWRQLLHKRRPARRQPRRDAGQHV